MYLLGVDPGHTTGYVIVNSIAGKMPDMIKFGQIPFNEITDWLQGLPDDIDIVVMEEYKLFQSKAMAQTNANSRSMKTSQVEGMVKYWAARNHAKVIMQPPSIKAYASKQSGLKPTGAHNKNSHWIDAFNHVYFYLLQDKRIEVRTS